MVKGFKLLEKESQIIKEKGGEILKIGVIESFRKFVPQLMIEFLKRNPEMDISIIERNSNNILEELLNYNIHFGVTTNKVDHSHVESVKLLSQNFSVVFHRNHFFNELDDINIKDFENLTLVQSMPGYQLYELISDKIELNHVNLANTFRVETLESALEIIRHNLGVTLIPSSYARNLNDDDIRVFHLKEDKNNILDINLIYNKNRYLSQPIYDFIKVIECKSFNKNN